MGFWAAAIPAIGSLVSSLFGGRKQKTETTMNLPAMVQQAVASGFNPLTVLKNGGAQGFTTTTTGATPFASRLAEGLSGAAQSFFQNYNPMEERTQEMGYRVMEAQLANLQASTAETKQRTLKFGQVPVRSAPARQQRPIGSNIPKTGKLTPAMRDAAAAAGKAIAIDHMQTPGAGPNGEVLPMWVKWRDRNGVIVEVPSADLPESEQFMVPSLGRGENAIVKPIQRKYDRGELYKRTPWSKDYREHRRKRGIPDWMPTFSYE